MPNLTQLLFFMVIFVTHLIFINIYVFLQTIFLVYYHCVYNQCVKCFMWFESEKSTAAVDKDKLIAEINELVLKQYSQHDIKLIKNTTSKGSIELHFAVAGEDVLQMSIESSNT